MDFQGNICSEIWFDELWFRFANGFASVRIGNKWNLIDANVHLLSDVWFDRQVYMGIDDAIVIINGRHYAMDRNGEVEINGEERKLRPEDILNESYISLKDYILESLGYK